MDADELKIALQSAGIMTMKGNADAMKREALKVHLGQVKLSVQVREDFEIAARLVDAK